MKFDPRHSKTPEQTETKIGMGDYVPDTNSDAKFHYNTTREFPPHIGEDAYQMFTRLVFFGFFQLVPPKPLRRFSRSIVKRRRFVQGCSFWGPKNDILHFDTVFAKKRKFLVDFRRDLRNVSLKTGLNIWGLHQ